ncbi:ArsC family reductase [Qipengyuania sp. RANM35]|uniref:ArsC family reductase n=1 Tax=Qipengyuania sp. RANM35 TaxID=3068635 RepID=UPI0034DB7B91
MTIQFYGIPNCDTVKKARTWLEGQGFDYTFHDYKKEGANAARLGEWADVVGWEALLNRRGTTFRKLPDAAREGIDRDKAIALMVAQPSIIKRPVVEHGDQVLVGFDPAAWAAALD